MNTGIPYRKRCNGQGDVCAQLGHSIFQNYKSNQKYTYYFSDTSPVPQGIPGGNDYTECEPCGSTVADICTGGLPAGANWQSAFFAGTRVTPEVGEQWQSSSFLDGAAVDFVNGSLQTFSAGTTEDFGVCHQIGFKAYAGMGQWNGSYGFNSADSCATPDKTIPADQQKFLTLTFTSLNYRAYNIDEVYPYNKTVASVAGAYSINPLTGEFSSTVALTDDFYFNVGTLAAPNEKLQQHLSGGSGYNVGAGGVGTYAALFNYAVSGTTYSPGAYSTTPVDGLMLPDVFCKDLFSGNDTAEGTPFNLASYVKTFNLFAVGGKTWLAEVAFLSGDLIMDGNGNVQRASGGTTGSAEPTWNTTLGGTTADGSITWTMVSPAIPNNTNVDSYSASDSFSNGLKTHTIALSWTRTQTTFTWSLSYHTTQNADGSGWPNTMSVGDPNIDFSGVLTLSNPWTFAQARADVETNSLAVFSLNGPEKWRTDPWTSIMPLAQRRQIQANVGLQPAAVLNATVNDLQNPINDANNNSPFTVASATAELSWPGTWPPPGWKVNTGNNGRAIGDGTHLANTPGWKPTYDSTPLDWMPTYAQIPWFDPTCWGWIFPDGTALSGTGYLGVPNAAATGGRRLFMDGAIIGKPMSQGPAATQWFDFYLDNVAMCPCPTEDSDCTCTLLFPEYRYTFGGTLGDSFVSLSSAALCSSSYHGGIGYSTFLPPNATHWTNNAMAHGIPRGAMIDVGGVPGPDGQFNTAGQNIPGKAPIFIVKWAQARLPVPSANFARPCGGDRVAIDEATAQCFTSGLTMAGALPDLTGKTVLLWGTGSDGIYTGCSQAANVLTLGTKIADLPTDYFHPFCGLEPGGGTNHFAAGFVGIVRWPNAPALCGRQQFTFTDNSGVTPGTIAVVFNSLQTNLRVGDNLDFWTATMSALPANCPVVTRTDDTHFIVTAAFASMAGAVWATSHGAANWYWNDSAQKFDFRWGQWDTSNRVLTDGSPTVTFDGCNQSCQQMSPCCPQVVAFTPNGDVDAAWESHWFGTIQADGIYGSRSQLNVEFECTDPLWQPPLKPVDTDADHYTVVEDDGTCHADSATGTGPAIHTIYFPPHPRVEARCASPDGTGGSGAGMARNEAAPAFTTDALGNTPAWPAMSQPVSPGTICKSYNVTLEPWMRYAGELVSGIGCRFAAWYYALLNGLGFGK